MDQDSEIKVVEKAPSVSVSVSRKIPDDNYGNVEAQIMMSSGTNQGLKAKGSKEQKIDELFEVASDKLDEKLAELFVKQARMAEMENVLDDALRMLKAGKSDQAMDKMQKYVSGGNTK